MNTVRIGIIGLGIGKWHLDSFSSTKRAEVVALCDANEKLLKKTGKAARVTRLYTDVGSILKDRDVDAVSVCLPNYLHSDVAVAALRAGKHVLCEKPLAASVRDARKIVRAQKASDRTCMVAMKLRFMPEAHYISRDLNKGTFGDAYYGYTHYMRPPGGIPTGTGNWFITKSKSGGGALIDNGVHLLDLNWYLMGCPRPVYAFGSTCARFGPQMDGIKDSFDVEDFGCGLIKFENGASIYLDNAWASMVAGQLIGLRILGTTGGATMWPFSIIKCSRGKNRAVTPNLSRRRFKTQFEHFVECVVGDSETLSPPGQGLTVLKMLDAIYRSSERGSAVKISDEAL